MRLPNGYGSVVKLSGKLRRPYMVRKTVGYDDRAYPVYDIIGYFKTRADALAALAKYNEDPYDIDLSKSTMKDIYRAWSAEANMKPAMKTSMSAAFGHCSALHDKQYKTLRKGHMQAIIDNCGKGYSTRNNIALLFRKLDAYAYDHDIISKKYADNLKVGEADVSTKHKVFTDAEVRLLWKHQGEPYVDEALFMLYTGCRVSEMLQMRDVDLKEQIMTGGVKTAAGKNRVIPIHSKLLPIVKAHYNGDTLFQNQPEYLKRWRKAMAALGLDHFTHDCRHTFRTKLEAVGANKVAIDRIMGHASGNIGDRVYTHKTVEDLREAIEMLTY